jgi:hypothetical protein
MDLTAIPVLGKLLQVGLATFDSLKNEGFGTQELSALTAVTDLLGEVTGRKK